jgi:DNA-binding response OmpR family regulator
MQEKRIKILIAEDEPDVLDVMRRKIISAGFDVVIAQDGEIASQKIAAEDPDVLILDLNLPQKDGFTILKELRANPPGPKWQPVIIVSGRTDLEDVKRGFELEADHYITKPCNMTDLLKAIHTVISLIPGRQFC